MQPQEGTREAYVQGNNDRVHLSAFPTFLFPTVRVGGVGSTRRDKESEEAPT